jgi:indolepyruvate ferredoxin oxidoreductase, alpha subunit
MKKMIIGNQAIAYGALAAGVDVVAGYPGTPSSEVIAELFAYAKSNKSSPYVEWSTNEKVAFEIAAGAAWAGKRALATMKMSGANVAADSILSVAYSGTRGGLVIYIADDPGAEAGMPEQDTRVFAEWAGLPVLETTSPGQAYQITQFAFELSEACELPVILRSVTSVAHAQEMVDEDFTYSPLGRKPEFERDIFQFTKAGSKICLDQHTTLLSRLAEAEKAIHRKGINTALNGRGELYAIGVGNLNPYLKELYGNDKNVNLVFLESSYPLDRQTIHGVLKKAERIVVFEELEPVVEKLIRSEASEKGFSGVIIGKIGGQLPRVGKYKNRELRKGIALLKQEQAEVSPDEKNPGVKHPITFCAGCPHRGTYMALNRALKKTKLGQKETIVTGDIGCTILGMNPPFDSCWTEVSMGSSLGLAQGFMRAGFEKPVVATIGDSTFFHAGIPPLINAVQHQSDLLLIILDNGWTSMTGFQINPGTDKNFQQQNNRKVEIEKIVEAVGVDDLQTVYPFEIDAAVETISESLLKPGVRVVISKEECALTKGRRDPNTVIYTIDADTCTFCRACLRETGCPALAVTAAPDSADGDKQVMRIDGDLCTGCGLCSTCCRFDSIHSRER